MKDFPYYEDIAQLIPPMELTDYGQYASQRYFINFDLLSFQMDKIRGSRQVLHSTEHGIPTTTQYPVQVQLRLWSSSSENQGGMLPSNFTIWINNKLVHSPQAPIKGLLSQPLDITTIVMHQSSNSICIRWLSPLEHNYFISVNLVRKLTAQQLLLKLMEKSILPSSSTQQAIKDLLSKRLGDPDLCAPTSLQVSLTCPLGKSRMRYPCRGVNCKHLQCFDANLFLMMNEKKTSFLCPVCSQQLKFSDLSIDGYFMDVILNWGKKKGGSGNDVEVLGDGSWLPVSGESPKNLMTKRKSPSEIETIDLWDDDDDDDDDDKKNGIFILNEFYPSSPMLNFVRPFPLGMGRNSSRRNLSCGRVNQVNYDSQSVNEQDVIEID